MIGALIHHAKMRTKADIYRHAPAPIRRFRERQDERRARWRDFENKAIAFIVVAFFVVLMISAAGE